MINNTNNLFQAFLEKFSKIQSHTVTKDSDENYDNLIEDLVNN